MTSPISQASSRQLGRVARGGALNFAGAIVSACTSFLLIVAVSRGTSEDAAGSLFAASSLTLILFTVATLGTDTGLARFVLPLESKRRYGALLAVIRTSSRAVAVVSVGIGAIVFVAAPVLRPLVGLDTAEGTTLIRIVAVTVPFAALADLGLSMTRAFGTMRPTVVLDDMFRSLAQLGIVAVAAALGWGAIGLTATWALPYATGAALAGVVAVRLVRDRRGRWDAAAPEQEPVEREFWAYTWPRAVARVTQIGVQRADIVLVALLLDPAAAAVYTAATRFVVFGQLAGQAIYRVLQPRFSALIGRDEHDTVRDVFRISTAWTMALSWPIYIGVACGAPLYLRLFGHGTSGSAEVVVVVMAVSMMMAMAAGPLDTLLLMAGHSMASLLIAITTLVVDVVGCLVLLPTQGITGAAIAWGAAVVTKNALSYWQVRRATGLVPVSPAGAIVGVASLATIGAPLLVVGAFTDWAPLPFLATGVLCAAAYGLVLWFARGPLALDAIIDAFHRNGSTPALGAT